MATLLTQIANQQISYQHTRNKPLEMLTLEKIEKIAIQFNLAFGTSTVVSAPKTRSYKLAFISFTLTIFFLAISAINHDASPFFVLLSSLAAAAFEVIGIYLFASKYDQEYRQFMLRKCGVLSNESKFSYKNLEVYKTLWLKKHFKVPQESYLEIIENIDKTVTLGKRFKENSLALGEKTLGHIFSGRLFLRLFTLSFLSIALNVSFKFIDLSGELKMQIAPYLNKLPAYTIAGGVIAIYTAALFGLLALAWRAGRDLYLERRKGKCSKNSMNLFVQTLIKRATLPIYDARALARTTD